MNPAPEVAFDRTKVEREALDAVRLLHEITPETVEHANAILTLLVKEAKARPDWEEVMNETLAEAERDLNLDLIADRRETFRLAAPVGAVAMGTGALRAKTDLPGPVAQRAIQILKATARLVQCGRGRGKCLVVLQKTPLNYEKLVPRHSAVAERLAREHLDSTDLLKLATDSILEERRVHEERCTQLRQESEALAEELRMVKEEAEKARAQAKAAKASGVPAAKLKELMAENRRQKRENDELKAVLANKDKTIEQLEGELNEKMVSSWT